MSASDPPDKELAEMAIAFTPWPPSLITEQLPATGAAIDHDAPR